MYVAHLHVDEARYSVLSGTFRLGYQTAADLSPQRQEQSLVTATCTGSATGADGPSLQSERPAKFTTQEEGTIMG